MCCTLIVENVEQALLVMFAFGGGGTAGEWCNGGGLCRVVLFAS